MPGNYERMIIMENQLEPTQGELRCPACGHLNSKSRHFCSECSTRLNEATTSELTSFVGNRIMLIAGGVFLASLFMEWASAGGFLISNGLAMMRIGISHASGMPLFSFLALVAVIGCALLSIPSLRFKQTALVQIALSVLGLLSFLILFFELKAWKPFGQLESGGWIALLATIGLLIGAIIAWGETRE
jgi:hypothetical protein